MSIEKLSMLSSGLSSWLNSRVAVQGRGSDPASGVRKNNFGEPLPKLVDISNDPFLTALFSQQGSAERIRKRLMMLSRKRGVLVPARGIIASALSVPQGSEEENQVFVGVEFLAEYHKKEDTLAGVLAHEWGHLVSEYPFGLNPDEMTLQEGFDLRKEEEARADAHAGEMLYHMNYSPEGLIEFLSKQKICEETAKYHGVVTRAAIIRAAFEDTRRRETQTRNFFSSQKSTYSNPFTAKLIGVG